MFKQIVVMAFVFALFTAVNQAVHYLPPMIWIDAWSGKEYIVVRGTGIFPRMTDDGKHKSEWDK